MTILLTKTVRIAGTPTPAGTELTLSASDEAYFVSANMATYVTRNPSVQSLAMTSVVRDAAGRITSYTDDGVPVTLTYDGAGRVATLTRAAVVTTMTYDASGNVTQIVRGLP